MAEVAVFSLIEKITAVVAAATARSSRSSNSKPLQDVHLQMIRITRELEVVKEFLKHIGTSSRGENEQVLITWAKQIQDAAHDIEDIVDEYTYTTAGGSWAGVRAYIFTTFNDSKVTALHEISAKLEAAEASLSQLSRTKDSYGITASQRIPNANEESDISYHLAEESHFMDEDDLVGIDDHKRQLIEYLIDEDPRRAVVSVLGMGGVGKTTLVTRVYKDQKIITRFGSRAWVTVSQSYKIDDLLRKILKELYQERMEETAQDFDAMDYRQLVETLRSHLDRKRYLIVLDDVWQVNVWTDISYALLANNQGSRVVITTRMQEVTSVAAADRIMRLDPLPKKMAWDLFCKKAFPREEGNSCPEELKPWAAKMVDECEGLPLAIVSIGNLLSHKERVELTWKNMYDSLTWSASENTGLHRASRILSLSIRNLPYHLRNCLLHCSLFPEDYPIARNRLIRLWVAEGFVKERRERSMEEVAEEYLNQLVGRRLIQVTDVNESGRVRFCRVHDLVRELIMWRSKDEHFAEVYDGKPEELSDRIRRLSLTKEDQSELLSTKMPLLRSFHTFSPVSTVLLSKCRLLRVLDLSSAPIESLPEEIGRLFNLHYLSIRETKVRNLPKSLGSLKKLETLDAVFTLVEDLPTGLSKLENLRHLMVKTFHRHTSRYTILGGGVKVPGGIGSLKSLQTLKAVVADETMVRQLGKLTQMKSLDIRGVRTTHSIDFSISISKMDRLLRLVVMARYKDDTLLLSNLTPPPQLRKLSLYGKLDKGLLPQWFTSLRTLTHLVLKMSRLKEDSLNSLMAMPNLVSLFLMQAYDGSKLCFRAGWHRKLKSLGLCDMINLNCIEIEQNALESLLEMTLVRCSELKTIPVGIENLKCLQKLELEGMPVELVEKLQEGGATEEDRLRLQHIPVIKNWYQRDEIWIEERLS
ncbi:hypothetical protein Cni_G28242 [Canna indica]|uniref:Uncharacterized protein n=1 Tax=Canna indica TaxID=4628 RepID=A0AAQ3L2N2_9LILI|nr:hypothetical protein Cni_G28242 [Canna indica]